ncbi:O-antigen/teichoic acid export membrane protein [Thermocatellispora tengchongensis]|uniref:O-antigen/teichoic acid export membrane protein n=1 Tax=Thermocatellispora tengchongensis TaxID=1073253 RepID=A0A840PFB3_9ACTN|nr:oligosaccharide flippase family protein [Thermocatellispora tengchongensis]MBB5136531.1 O-antigen/teichoic acid export membrane protein [Thermocatellispora tengchongensis]
MSTTASPPEAATGRLTGLSRKLMRDLRNPLFRNGYALMANTAITAVLGMGYWLLAARLYTPEDFGRGQALITGMRLFASLTALGFVGALARFIPVSGKRTAHLVVRAYVVAGATGVTAAFGFLLTLPLWGETYQRLAGFGPGLFFLASVLVWSIFTLQDVTLAGLRKATWVPVNSICFGLVKMAMLVGLASALPDDGIFVSWIIPTAMALIPINIFIFGFVIPRHVRENAPAAETTRPPTLREIGRFLAGDYPGTLSILAIVYVIPVMVASQVDEATFGYFSMAHTLGSLIETLAMNMATSLTVEGSIAKTQLARNARHALRRAFMIIVPVVVVTIVAAPLILSIFGPDFAEQGTHLLRLMALAVLPRVLIEIYLSGLRARSEARKLALVQIGLAVTVLASTMALFPYFGVEAVGYGLLFSELLVAALIFGGLRRMLDYGETPQRSVA